MTPPDPVTHVVKAGEQHLTRIAGDHGFSVLDPVWDASENAALKARRVNPHTLAVGDVVVIPPPDPKSASRPTGVNNQFTLIADQLGVSLRVLDEGGRPLANRAFRFVSSRRGATTPGTRPAPVTSAPDDVTDGDGLLTVPIDRTTGEAELTVHATNDIASPVDVRVRLLIGFLSPANTETGQRTRLNNMGYFAGFADTDADQLRWAIEEFEADHKVKHNLKVTGRSNVPLTFNAIAHEHGDLLKAERVPLAPEPAK